MDVTLRLEPLAQEMERVREPVLLIGHQGENICLPAVDLQCIVLFRPSHLIIFCCTGILRILYAYFMGLDRKEAPYVAIPLNNIIQLTPHAYGCHEKRFCLMMKEEMASDGQDEPITSMPTRTSRASLNVALNGSDANLGYSPSDPIMNAPSC
jgi:broad specificity phosphatase PhoE